MAQPTATPPTRRFLLECSGACGDLGTFIPHVIGAINVAGLSPAGVLFGFATFLIATGLFYGLPLPVQPMKAISAVILTGGLRPGEVAAAGIIIGVLLLVLGITGWIGRLARAIPQSVSAGLQLGFGLLTGVLGLKLILATPWLGFGSLALLFALTRVPCCPAAPLALAAAMLAGWATGNVGVAPEFTLAPGMPHLVVPSWAEVLRSFEVAVLPQLSLTSMGVFLSSGFLLLPVPCLEVCPGKAGMFSRRQSCRGKSQSPVVWIAEEMETEPSKPIDKISRGEITSHRAVSKENALWPRKR